MKIFTRIFQTKYEKEVERRIQSRQGERKVRRHIDSQRKQVQHYWELAKKAYALGDRDSLQYVVTLIHSTRQDIHNWERTLSLFSHDRGTTESGCRQRRICQGV